MGFLKRLFNRKEEDDGLVRVPNPYFDGLNDEFVLQREPDLAEIFSGPNPAPPVEGGALDDPMWNEGPAYVRAVLAMAYLSHPDETVRAETIDYAREMDADEVTQALVVLLADPEVSICDKAARAIWEREKRTGCKPSLEKLRNEFDGLTDYLGMYRAEEALQTLIEHAPDEHARQAIMKRAAEMDLPLTI